MSGIPCDGCGQWNRPTFARCSQCKKAMVDDKSKVKLLYDQLLVLESSFAKLGGVANFVADDDDIVETEMMRLRMDLEAKKEQCEALELNLHVAKEANELQMQDFNVAQEAWRAAAYESRIIAERHAHELRTWESAMASERAIHKVEVDHLKAQIQRFQPQLQSKSNEHSRPHVDASTAVAINPSSHATKRCLKTAPETNLLPSSKRRRNAPADDTVVTSSQANEQTLPPDEAKTTCFEWADGSVHPFPEDWHFPSVSCQDMWLLWFCGDPVTQVGPFRLLSEIDTKHGKQLFCKCKHVMEKLIAIAMDAKWISSEDEIARLARADLVALFVKAFHVLIPRGSDGSRSPTSTDTTLDARKATTKLAARLNTRACDDDMLAPSRKRVVAPIVPGQLFQWSNGLRKPFPEDWRFPTAPLEDLWVFWFRGDAKTQVGPFRLLPALHIDEKRGKQLYNTCLFLISKLIAIAKKAKWVSSANKIAQLPSDEFMALFSKAFDVLLPRAHSE
ncbi:Aste57867_946 [Aphanomyces stellatus]|uniref:Aste57867_946 protein n=1 Tax=Aphanomyces stellatus TaxID=120398 RepID=A0A485K4A5_9STRA|nr:hypothetical protein As57867_000945 [Aphanomyces stellatus]VFT78169.1 Aste57867_946 [Aphanomyces stellatus]